MFLPVMKKELKIYLFRHGQTPFNRDSRFTGWLDPGLTALGKKQAQEVAEKLKNKRFEIAFCTRLKRSKQTLKEVLKYHPECREIFEDNRMIERNYGDLNGMSHGRFIERIGKKMAKLGELEGLSRADRKRAEEFLGEEEFKLIHRGYDVPPPNGESFKMVEKRVGDFIKYLVKMMKKEKVSVAISAHGNSIRLFRKIMEGASIPTMTRWFIPYEKVYEYTIK